MTRTRIERALKKQQRSNAMWGDVDRSWMKWVRCNLCGQRVCVNNYADRKVRLGQIKFDDMIICLNCQAGGRREVIVALLSFVRALADKGCKKGACGQCSRCKALKLIQNLPHPPKAYRDDQSNGTSRE